MARLGRDTLLPSLVVAYPATFALLQARPYCPRCGGFSAVDVAALVVVAAGSLLAAVMGGPPLLARTVGLPGRSDDPFAASVRSPSRPTVAVLLGLSLAFAAFVALDVADVAEAVWKPVVLPLSFVLFAPVRAIYAGTFVFALALGAVGVGSPPALGWVVLSLVVGVGSGASAVWQFLLVEGLLGRRR